MKPTNLSAFQAPPVPRAAAAALGFLLAAVFWMTAAPDAAAQTLLVDQADTNSPDTVTTDQTYTEVHVGDNGTGEIDQTAGTFTVNGSSSAQGLFIGYNLHSNGTYNLSGTGSLFSNYATEVGTFGVGLFSQSAGSATFNNLGLYVGLYNGSNGTYNQTGGSVTTSGLYIGYYAGSTGAYTLGAGMLTTGMVFVGDEGSGTFTQNGGIWTTRGTGIEVGTEGGSAGTLNLNGGIVTTGSVLGKQYAGDSNGTLNLNGGTLQAAGNTTNFVSGLTTANVRAGGATIDTNGFNVTVPQALLHDSTLGTTADGGLSKVGLGTLTLAGANTYTGQTSVTAGTLAIPNGASIGVTGSLANLFVAGTAANAPTLNLSGGSVMAGVVRLGNNPGEVGTITQSAGTLMINGGNGSAQGLFVGYNSNDTGLYTLTGGSLMLNTSSFVGVFGNGTFNQSGGTVAVNGSSLLSLGIYNGSSGTYNLSGTGSLSGNIVIVGGDMGNGMGLLHQTGGTINLSRLQIGQNTGGSGAVGTYTLDAGTATAGAVYLGINTSSTGTVNLNGGTLTAGTVVSQAGTSTFRFNGGTLQASASDNPGATSNPSTFFSGVTNTYVGTGGAVIDTNGFNVTVASALNPDPANGNATDGGLTKNGAGTLTVSGFSYYSGPTTVNAGTLQAGVSINAFGNETAVTVANVAGATLALNGHDQIIGSLSGGGSKGGTVDVTGATLSVGYDGTSTTFAGTIAGSGGLYKVFPGMLTFTGNNTYTGTTVIADGALMVNNVPAKAGDSGTGSGPVYVQGGWLGGTGTVGGNVTVGSSAPSPSSTSGVRPLVVQGSGTLTPGVAVGDASMPGRLTINGSLTFVSGTSAFEVDLAGANAGTGYDQVLVGGSLSLSGTLTLSTGAGFTPTLLEKFYLIDLTGTGTTSGAFDGLAQGALVTDSAGNEYVINYSDHDPADTSNLLFDDVSLTAVSVVPEPGTWAWSVLGGAGLLGLILRRRLRASATGRS